MEARKQMQSELKRDQTLKDKDGWKTGAYGETGKAKLVM